MDGQGIMAWAFGNDDEITSSRVLSMPSDTGWLMLINRLPTHLLTRDDVRRRCSPVTEAVRAFHISRAVVA